MNEPLFLLPLSLSIYIYMYDFMAWKDPSVHYPYMSAEEKVSIPRIYFRLWLWMFQPDKC